MTEKQLCMNCKHLEHDGMFGIWCGVHGNNKNHDCLKFERKYEEATEPTPNTICLVVVDDVGLIINALGLELIATCCAVEA